MPKDRHNPADRDLGEATLSAVRSVAGARVGVELLVFGASLALARLVSPAEFGQAAVALIATALAATLLPAIFGALVQRDRLDREHAEAAALLGLTGGVALTVLTLLAAGPVAEPLFGEATADLVRIASPAFLLAGIAGVPQAMLQRRLEFGTLARIEVISSAAGAAAAVAAAVAGVGGEAIVIGALVGVGAAAALTIAAEGLARPRLHRASLGDIVRFGIPAGIGTLGYTSFRNVDYAIVGARLGAAQLGAYWRAFQLGVEYQRKISVIMLRVAFPVYSRSRDLDHMRAMRTRIVRTHATVIFPPLALLIALAPQLIPFLYGDAWEAAVLPAQILAVGGMTTALQTGIGPLLMAMGRTKPLMIYTWAALVVYGLAVFLAAPSGLTAVCVAATGAGVMLFLAGTYALGTRVAGIPMRSLVTEAGPALGGCVALLALAAPLAAGLSGLGLPDPAIVAAAGTPGVAAYLLVVRRISPAAWADLRLIAARLMRRPDQPDTTPPVGGDPAPPVALPGTLQGTAP